MLAIRDTGSGMDAQTRDRVFEPFFTTKAKGKGTGLGLPTVYGIVDQSGGAISIDTAVGRGTSIRIYLPVTFSQEEPERPAIAAPTLNHGGTETLLLVEDNDAVRELAVHALRKRGYTVHEARNAEEAIEWSLTSRIKPTLLVTDVVMPGLSGPNLAARLLQENPRLKVLYMSGYTDDATAVHGAFWGGVPLLQKPFTPAQLAERVRLALDASAGGRSRRGAKIARRDESMIDDPIIDRRSAIDQLTSDHHISDSCVHHHHVVAAVIERDDQFFLTRRHAGTHLEGMWEFPGGKVDAGESRADALRREIREELGAGVEVHDLVFEITHQYPDRTIALYFYKCTLIGEPQSAARAGDALGTAGELMSLGFPPADTELITRLSGPASP